MCKLVTRVVGEVWDRVDVLVLLEDDDSPRDRWARTEDKRSRCRGMRPTTGAGADEGTLSTVEIGSLKDVSPD